MKDKIKYLVMDVDGTLTDGKIHIGHEGEIVKTFSCKDGLAIQDILPKTDIIPVIITGRNSKILENRCKELRIEKCYQGIRNKTAVLDEVLAGQYTYENVAYIGDDLNDLPCMETVKTNGGLIGCPADAAKEVIAIADFVSAKDGGNGAVREFIEWLLQK